ncbi:MAG TPA: DUF3043 domain-containing protein [Actinotalea sp.]
MFSRNRSAAEPKTPAATSESAAGSVTSKGRPTPTRKAAEAARKRPLVPADRKVAAKAQRASSKEARDREYQALQTGDDRYLPLRDKGPVKRFIRDYVDARRNLGEYMIILALVMMFATLLTAKYPMATWVVLIVMYVLILATLVDAYILSRRLKKLLPARFGEAAVPRGSVMYGVTRAFQLRRMRLPKPQVARGQSPA